MDALKPASLVAVPLPNGSYAVLWMLEIDSVAELRRKKPRAYFNFVIMEGFQAAIPTATQLAALRVAEHPHPNGLPGRANIWKGCFFDDPPHDFTVIGTRALPAKTDVLFAYEGTMVFQGGEGCRAELFRTWRWLYDRPALEAEWAAADVKRDERADARRKALTLPKMRDEKPFASWSKMWPASAVKEVRRIFRDATASLIVLQHGGTARQRTAVLKRITSELNKLYDKEGCIETVECHQLVARIEDLAGLVGVSNKNERLTGHRDW
jgi:hypothetical protein